MTPERLIATFCGAHGGDFQSVSPGTGDKWSADDAALACSGYRDRRGHMVKLPIAAECAFRFRWAGDTSCVPALRHSLRLEALRLQRAEQWPREVVRLNPATGAFEKQEYLQDLVELGILEERYWWLLKRHDLWHAFMRVQPFVWRRTLSGRYEALRQRLDEWCGDARYHIRRKLRHER